MALRQLGLRLGYADGEHAVFVLGLDVFLRDVFADVVAARAALAYLLSDVVFALVLFLARLACAYGEIAVFEGEFYFVLVIAGHFDFELVVGVGLLDVCSQISVLVVEYGTEEIVESVNNILKAITASLLMEEVIAPKFNFKPKNLDTDGAGSGEDGGFDDGRGHTVFIDGFRGIKSDRVKDIIENDIVDLKAKILQDPDVQKAIGQNVPAETINNGLIPKVIRNVYPDLDDDATKELSTYVVIDTVLSHKDVKDINGQKFLEFANRLINVTELNLDLIYSVNPFMDAYEVMSKSLDARVFKSVQTYIRALRIDVTEDEARVLWPQINDFVKKFQREPNLDSVDPYERRLAEVLLYARRRKMEKNG